MTKSLVFKYIKFYPNVQHDILDKSYILRLSRIHYPNHKPYLSMNYNHFLKHKKFCQSLAFHIMGILDMFDL